MENLWPDLKIRSEYKNAADLQAFLAEQAGYLEVATNGLLRANTEMTVRDEHISLSFFMWPNGQQQMRYELLRLRSPLKIFPVVIETYHLEERYRYQKIASIEDLKEKLKFIFGDARTINIVRLLADDALEERFENDLKDGGREQAAEKEKELRPIAIGGLITEKSGLELSQASFLGVSGFLSVDTIRSLVKKPESKGSAVQQLNNKFVVTLEFKGPVKALLTASELERLHETAKKALNKHDH